MADHLPLQRSLCLLRHLQDGPQDRDTLASFVHIECDPTAYLDFSQKTYQKRFENDMGRLREWGVETDYYHGHYRLLSYGEFSPVGLPDHALEVLAPLLMNPSLTTHQICDAADINYIEFSCDGWEHLYNYIRKLEKQTEELETLKAKLRNLIQLVEQSNEFIIKAYREATREE